MKYAITLVAEIAKRNGWTGTRRRECTFADGSKQTLVFSRKPVELDELPPEIQADTKLVVREIPDEPESTSSELDSGLPKKGAKASKAKG